MGVGLSAGGINLNRLPGLYILTTTNFRVKFMFNSDLF